MEFTDELCQEIFKQNKKFMEKNKPTNKDRYNPSLERKYKKYIRRSETAVDRDRILFSSAFRRLEHKAQVYSNEKGDHYRTRLTHSLEVMQISRSLAKNLGLNEELAEAIALGHDIGHTPFGHEGEYVLDSIMRGENDLGNKIRPDFKKGFNFGGFKHNFFSLEILDSIENRYSEPQGLNLTWQVLEGILKHTKIQKGDKKWDLDRFLINGDKDTLKETIKKNSESSVTLEGQIVAIADEIAQRQHDLDDGLRDNNLKLNIKGIIKQIKMEEIINNAEDSDEKDILKELRDNLKEISNLEDEKLMKKQLSSSLVNYFIEDITLNSLKNLSSLDKNIDDLENSDKQIVTKKLICCSKNCGEGIDKNIDKFINKRIINSYNVSRFDGKSKYIIKQLFKAYYSNPRQIPPVMLEKLIKKVEENCENFKLGKENKKAYDYLYDINLETVSPEKFKSYLDVLKLENLSTFMSNKNIPQGIKKDYLSNLFYQLLGYVHVTSAHADYTKIHLKNNDVNDVFKIMKNDLGINDFELSELENYINKIKEQNTGHIFKEIEENISEWLFNKFKDVLSNEDIATMNNEELFYRCLLENHYAFLKTISEYIAKMSDNFAKKEFKKLYMS